MVLRLCPARLVLDGLEHSERRARFRPSRSFLHRPDCAHRAAGGLSGDCLCCSSWLGPHPFACVAHGICGRLQCVRPLAGRGENPSWGVGLDSGKPDKPVTETTIRHRCSELSREAGLTRREEEVLVLLTHDMPASEIEYELCVSNATVKTHTRAVYRKLNVHSRREIVGLVGAGLENAEFSKRA